jgi:hypothetical protein
MSLRHKLSPVAGFARDTLSRIAGEGLCAYFAFSVASSFSLRSTPQR